MRRQKSDDENDDDDEDEEDEDDDYHEKQNKYFARQLKRMEKNKKTYDLNEILGADTDDPITIKEYLKRRRAINDELEFYNGNDSK